MSQRRFAQPHRFEDYQHQHKPTHWEAVLGWVAKFGIVVAILFLLGAMGVRGQDLAKLPASFLVGPPTVCVPATQIVRFGVR